MSFKGSRMLGSHLRLHGKRRIHPCNICGKEFNHSSSLSRHRLIHKKGKGLPKDAALGPNMPALRHSLKAGGKNKKTKRQQQHVAAVIIQGQGGGDKFYACPQCDMSFRTSTQLSKHQEGEEEQGSGGRRRRRHWSPRLQPVREAVQSCLQPGTAPADPQAADGGERVKLQQHQKQLHVKTGLPSAATKTAKTYTCSACNKTFMHSSSFSPIRRHTWRRSNGPRPPPPSAERESS
ncbi:hypothetical protein D5F01_LYC21480 [Larimichthys crocea]|uniref:C2H2-type domain-containing protein n=1 Tax=Larimichthys crocea TaxID=215358 RepID=A0A6G0HPG4_LARCR|nr:hypothetical protein D5F01_LYC21480 [Larimichthys crocea]